MMKSKAYHCLWASLFLMALLSGCSGLGKISDGEYLYTGSEIKFDSVHGMKTKAAVKAELSDLIGLQPNTKFLWMRPFLSLHNLLPKPKKESGFWFWLKYKFGEPPALLASLNPESLDVAMENRLQNRGYFDAGVTHLIDQKRKAASVTFTAFPRKPYILKSIHYPEGEKTVLNEIRKMRPTSLLKPGEAYNLADFQSERSRIDNILKNKGYFYFSPDYLLFDADTAIGGRQIDVELKLKPEISGDASIPYKINEVFVFDDFSLGDYHPDTTMIGGFHYIRDCHNVDPHNQLIVVLTNLPIYQSFLPMRLPTHLSWKKPNKSHIDLDFSQESQHQLLPNQLCQANL